MTPRDRHIDDLVFIARLLADTIIGLKLPISVDDFEELTVTAGVLRVYVDQVSEPAQKGQS